MALGDVPVASSSLTGTNASVSTLTLTVVVTVTVTVTGLGFLYGTLFVNGFEDAGTNP